jgi:hypothetical protein
MPKTERGFIINDPPGFAKPNSKLVFGVLIRVARNSRFSQAVKLLRKLQSACKELAHLLVRKR